MKPVFLRGGRLTSPDNIERINGTVYFPIWMVDIYHENL